MLRLEMDLVPWMHIVDQLPVSTKDREKNATIVTTIKILKFANLMFVHTVSCSCRHEVPHVNIRVAHVNIRAAYVDIRVA